MQYEDKTGELMMLPSDLALVNDPNFIKGGISINYLENIYKEKV